MINVKCFSVPKRLNDASLCKHKSNDSFNNFQELKLNGSQKLLSFGEYSSTKKYNRKNRLKVIEYFYRDLNK